MSPYTVLCAPGDGTWEFTGTLPGELHFQAHILGVFPGPLFDILVFPFRGLH